MDGGKAMSKACARQFLSADGATLRVALLAALALLASLPFAVSSQAQAESAELTLTTPVRQMLHRVREDWQAWKRAYYQNDREGAEAALASIQSAAADLGMQRLPELAATASTYASRSARSGNYTRAAWALDDARTLDPSRPETDFARATVMGRRGDYLRAVTSTFNGYLQLVRLEPTRTALLQGGVLWLILVLLVSGALFVIIQMAVKGVGLIEDLRRPFAALPLPLALVLVVVAMLWPLLFPGGGLWLLLYWAVLLFGYCAASERVVLAALLLATGVAPVILRSQQGAMELVMSPPLRLLSALENGCLYSGLFSDLEILRGLLPEHPAVVELEADLHRRIGQWEMARLRYGTLAELEPANGAALNNLGVYNLRRQDFGSAISYLLRATDAEPDLAEAFFNLSQAYSGAYAFGDSHQALAQAQKIDRERVDAWIERGESNLAIPITGSARRYREIHDALVARWHTDAPKGAWARLRGELALSVSGAALLAALLLHVVRRRFGYGRSPTTLRRSKRIGARLMRALIPGWQAAWEGQGGRGFGLVLVVVALVTLPLAGGLRYRLPVTIDIAHWPLLALALAGLMLVVLVRVGQEFNTGDGGR